MPGTVAISQPMFFPWLGLFEQAKIADVFVFLDDAQLSKGTFVPRVQIRAEGGGSRWLTAPVRHDFGQRICDVRLATDHDWRRSHIDALRQAYASAPFLDDMLAIVRDVYASTDVDLARLNIEAFRTVASYLDIAVEFAVSSELGVPGQGSQRVLDLVRHLFGTTYITGHGAKDYLDHEAFEAAGVAVEYMDYRRKPYVQVHGGFDAHVSALDAIANLGPGARLQLCSGTVPWRVWLERQAAGSR